MSKKEYSDSEIEELLDSKVKRAIIAIYQQSEERWIAFFAILLILVGIVLFCYALEKGKK